MWLKIGAHPCWKVQKALDEQGIEYDVVKGPLSRGKREELERISGQRQYPVIQFEDGSTYRAESKDMAARIREGKLFEGRGGPAQPPGSDQPGSDQPGADQPGAQPV
jgi:glutaredoxin